MTTQPFNVMIPLDQPIGYFLNDCYNRKMQQYHRDLQRGKTNAINLKIEWHDFISCCLKEIFAPANDNLRPPGWISPSATVLMSLGYKKEEAIQLANYTLNMILGEITLVAPTITFSLIEEWQWGICEPNTLMISLPVYN